MSEENVETIRVAFAAYNRGDVDAAVADFAPDCEYIATGALPGAGRVSRGPEGYKQFVGWLRSEFDDARIDVHELVEAGDEVLVSMTIRGRGRRSGVPTNWDIWQVWTLRDGKVVRGKGFMNREEALEAAGLSE
jgi:ketosteroid isomerase-like protein